MPKRKTPPAVAKKAQHMMKAEGKSPREAFGAAYGMYREHRLTKEGGYKRKKRG